MGQVVTRVQRRPRYVRAATIFGLLGIIPVTSMVFAQQRSSGDDAPSRPAYSAAMQSAVEGDYLKRFGSWTRIRRRGNLAARVCRSRPGFLARSANTARDKRPSTRVAPWFSQPLRNRAAADLEKIQKVPLTPAEDCVLVHSPRIAW